MASGAWTGDYDAQDGREPRELLTEILRAFDAEHLVWHVFHVIARHTGLG